MKICESERERRSTITANKHCTSSVSEVLYSHVTTRSTTQRFQMLTHLPWNRKHLQYFRVDLIANPHSKSNIHGTKAPSHNPSTISKRIYPQRPVTPNSHCILSIFETKTIITSHYYYCYRRLPFGAPHFLPDHVPSSRHLRRQMAKAAVDGRRGVSHRARSYFSARGITPTKCESKSEPNGREKRLFTTVLICGRVGREADERMKICFYTEGKL